MAYGDALQQGWLCAQSHDILSLFNATSMFGGQDGVQILSFLISFSFSTSFFFFGGNLVYSGVFGAWHALCSICIGNSWEGYAKPRCNIVAVFGGYRC